MKAICLSALFLLPLTSCAIKDHTFPERVGAPDVVALEKARQAEEAKGEEGGLGDLSWYPLLAMNFEIYSSSKPPMPSGTTYAEMDAYGPLFMFADAETFHYDDDQELYERKVEKSYLWGLYRYERDDVRVPMGWRYDEQTSLLFGILRWPSEVYITDEP